MIVGGGDATPMIRGCLALASVHLDWQDWRGLRAEIIRNA